MRNGWLQKIIANNNQPREKGKSKKKRKWKRNNKEQDGIFMEGTQTPKNGSYIRCMGFNGEMKNKKCSPKTIVNAVAKKYTKI